MSPEENFLNGKKILFFSPAFFGYEYKIKTKMQDLGAIVDMYDERSISSAWNRALLKISTKIFKKKSEKYYYGILSQNKNKNYDYVIVVKCDMTPTSVLEKIKLFFPAAKMCLYLWDSVENIPEIEYKFKYFDTLHSFDLNDCKKYPCLKFRPLFYADEFQNPYRENKKHKYDLCFLGTIHSDRYKIISKIKDIAESYKLNCYWFFYLQSKFIYSFYKLTKCEFFNAKKDEFSFNSISSNEIAKVVSQSNIVVDIQHPQQTGLTMRTIEMLGMNKKIITTNASIKEYDFYNPNNVSVIDRKKITLDFNFLKSNYEKIPKDIYNRYSLKSWIKDVLN